jgi:hypothetical protein
MFSAAGSDVYKKDVILECIVRLDLKYPRYFRF